MVSQLHIEMDEDVSQNTNPGCVWGIFRALNYNCGQNNIKKALPCIKHRLPKYSRGTGRPNTRSIDYNSEYSRIPVSTSRRKTSSTNKRSLKTRIRSLISKESPKKECSKRRIPGSPTQPRLYVSCKSTQRDSEVEEVKKKKSCRKINKSGKNQVLEECEAEEEASMDVLEIYRVNKDLFSKVLKYTDGGIAKSFCNLETHEARAKLTRSCSYPSRKLPRVFKFSELGHKQNEVWSHSKIDKLFVTTKFSRIDYLNELPFEKYAHLLPRSSIEEPRLSLSTGLSLTNECLFKRISSVSRIDYYSVFQNEPSCDGHSTVLVVKTDLDSNKNIENGSVDSNRNVEKDCSFYGNVEKSDDNVKIEDQSKLVEIISDHEKAKLPKINDKSEEQMFWLKDSKKEEEIEFSEVSELKPTCLSSFLVVKSNSGDDATSLTNFLAYEDFEGENSFHDKEFPVDSQRDMSWSSTTSSKIFYGIENKSESHKRSYDDFNYVSEIIERSGFRIIDFFASWYSSDQPLSPWVFDEVETYWPHKDLHLKDDFCNHHKLLFDLINEVLVQIYNTFSTYYPGALSSNCRVPLMPVKFVVLDEVWGKVSKIMNSTLGSDQMVENIVARDIQSDVRWMNLQLESECVALELEDMFFDELLEEILCS